MKPDLFSMDYGVSDPRAYGMRSDALSYACNMATQITLKLAPIDVKNIDQEFEVRQNGVLLGRLKISRGGLDWYRANAKARTGRATWAQMKDWMEGN